jgi:hypothetical protein
MSWKTGQNREEILWRRKTSLFWGANREKLLSGAINVLEKGPDPGGNVVAEKNILFLGAKQGGN